MTGVPVAERAGLQAERTDLSWIRTSLAFLINGLLLMLRRELSTLNALHIAAIVGAFVFAGLAAVMAFRRRRMLATRPLPAGLAAPVSLWATASGAAGFGLLVLAAIALKG